ncbi:MAG: large-conductance mechanosensitive channel protein MscL [Bacteroidales bacterium]|jgi:large conductance mechanosensitive channel|nr:large-conductance mechanosensitive channel protein MscL [Bacteroidales bacterium]
MKILKEFKEFAVKGNIIDLAVGIIIGAAFGKIIASLVNDIIMPPIGLLLGGLNFTDMQFIMKEAVKDPLTGKETAAVALRYGSFIQTLVDFTIIAFSVFMLLKGIISLKKKKVEEQTAAPATPPAPTKDQELLSEIRDILKNK